MCKTILAKSRNSEKGLKEESLVEHIERVLYVYEKIVSYIKENNRFLDNLKTICVLHDLGKMNIKFQDKIRKANDMDKYKDNKKLLWKLRGEYRSIDDKSHNVFTGAFLKNIFNQMKIDENIISVLYRAGMLHHGNHLKYISISNSEYERALYEDVELGIFKSSEYNVKEVESFIEKTLEIDIDFQAESFLDYNFLRHLNKRFMSNDKNISQQDLYSQYILYKGFLNLLDHTASTQILDFIYTNDLSNEEIDHKLIQHISSNGNINKSKIIFYNLQEKIRQNQNKNILTTAFTGSGKTIADYRWGGRRKVYLVPNKISAENFYFDALEILGLDMVGILHGDISIDIDNEDGLDISLQNSMLTRNLIKPYIIATLDQYLISMFKYPNYEKTFASIYNSNITVDEVHLLTPRMFLILVYFIEFAHKYLNTRFHLMTATMPQIYSEKLKECDVDFFHIADEDSKPGKNIEINITQDTIIPTVVADGLLKDYKVLIVKNTITGATDAYSLIKEKFPEAQINLIHSRFKLKDRKKKYDEIRKQKGDIWVSTQMVEVSLDLDFQIIISDSAPMDSIIQRMGRCNRHNRLQKGFFYMLDNYKERAVYDLALKQETHNLLKGEDLLTMERRKELLRKYYNKDKVRKYYEREFKYAEDDIREIYGITREGELNGESLIFNYEPYLNLVDSRKEAVILFRNLEMDTKVILSEDYEEIINMRDKHQLYRKIQEVSIPISRRIYRQLLKKDDAIKKDGKLNIVKENCGWIYDYEMGFRRHASKKNTDKPYI